MSDQRILSSTGRMFVSCRTLLSNVESIFSSERTRYDGFPVWCPPSEYERVVERYIERAKTVSGVLAVARFGNIAHPGISDLDLVVVTEPTLQPRSGQLLSASGLSEQDRQLCVHDPIVVPADLAKQHLDNLGSTEPKVVWGSLRNGSLGGGQPGRWHQLCHLIERLPVYLEYFARWAFARRVRVRWALLLLNSLRHVIKPATELLPGAPPAWSSFTLEVEQLRSRWFDLHSDSERIHRLAVTISRGWQTLAELCFSLEQWLLDQNLLPCLGSAPFWSVFVQNTDGFGVIARVSDASQLTRGSVELSSPLRVLRLLPSNLERRLSFSWTIVPSFQFALFMAAVGHAPLVGQRLLQRWMAGRPCGALRPETDLEYFLVERLRRLEAHAVFLKRNSLSFGISCSRLLFGPEEQATQQSCWRRRWLRAGALACTLPRLRRMIGQNRIKKSA